MVNIGYVYNILGGKVMKKTLILSSLVLTLICTQYSGLTVVSADTITVPSDWQCLLSEDFNADADTAVTSYTSTAFPNAWTDDGTYKATKPSVINATSDELRIYCKNGGNASVSNTLNTPLDLSADGDYYFMYDCNFNSMTVGSTYITLYDTSATPKILRFGTTQNNSTMAPYQETTTTQLLKVSPTNASYWPVNVMRTALFQISTRSGKNSVMRFRLFGDASGETPSINPKYWDTVKVGNFSTLGTNPFSKITITASTNENSEKNNRFDNFRIYKAPAVNSYYGPGTDVRYIVDNAVVGNTLTLDTIDAAKLVSMGWYDCSSGEDVLMTNDASYTPTADMAGKLIKAVVTVKVSDTENTTYIPFMSYVRDVFDYSTLTAKLNSTNKDYTKWSNWPGSVTKADFTATIMKNAVNAATNNYWAALVTGQYSKDGQLKSIMITKYSKKLGDLTVTGSTKLTNTFTFNHTAGAMNYAPGDYFKSYVWTSAYTNSALLFDTIKPLTFNANSEYKQILQIPEP